MRSRRRLERLEAAAAEREQAWRIGVRVQWVNEAGETLEIGAPVANAAVALTLDGSKPEAPGWLADDDGGRLTAGKPEPPKRKAVRTPPPEPGSRAWYVAKGLYVGDHFTEMALGNPSSTISMHRASPPPAVNLGFHPGAQWRRSRAAGMR